MTRKAASRKRVESLNGADMSSFYLHFESSSKMKTYVIRTRLDEGTESAELRRMRSDMQAPVGLK